jgi:LacI family transcriptional regulator
MAFVSGALDSFDNSERTRAFLSEAQKFEVPVACYNGNFTEASGYAAGTTLIRSGKLPEAVFCANDQMAIGFLRAMSEHKLKAPQDIAVVGFDDIQIARYIQPSLTTVGTSRFAWGAQAAGHLLEYLEHHTPFTPYRLPVNLIQRESSIRFAAAAPKST